MKNDIERCLVVLCDKDFKLIEILKQKNINVVCSPKDQLVKIISPFDYTKYLAFTLALKKETAIFNHEISVITVDDPYLGMNFGGVFWEDRFIITAFSNYLDLYEELLSINSYQTNILRKKMKQMYAVPVNHQQFMEINNDLINTQRELHKKNTTIKGLLKKTNDLNQELTLLNSTKDRLFSIIGHDLKAPLANISSLLNLVSMSQVDYEVFIRDGIFETLNTSVGLTMQMLENLLEWSRIQLGEKSFNPKSFTLQSVLETTFNLFSVLAKEKKVQITKMVPEDLRLYGDPKMIEVVIRNLLSNAIKFTQSGGEVIVSVEIQDATATISVKDSGIGMSKEKIQKLFQLTSDQVSYGTNGEKGTGFGLLLCNEFVKYNNGKLTVHSIEGESSTFAFTVPISQ